MHVRVHKCVLHIQVHKHCDHSTGVSNMISSKGWELLGLGYDICCRLGFQIGEASSVYSSGCIEGLIVS